MDVDAAPAQSSSSPPSAQPQPPVERASPQPPAAPEVAAVVDEDGGIYKSFTILSDLSAHIWNVSTDGDGAPIPVSDAAITGPVGPFPAGFIPMHPELAPRPVPWVVDRWAHTFGVPPVENQSPAEWARRMREALGPDLIPLDLPGNEQDPEQQ